MKLQHAIEHHADRVLGEGGPLKVAVATVMFLAQLAGSAWANVPVLYQIAIALLMFDWLTGTAKAMILGNANSDAGKQGIVKSGFYLGFLYLADVGGQMGAQVATVAPAWLSWIGVVSSWLPFYAFASIGQTETNSAFENFRDIAAHYNVRIPPLEGAIKLLRLSNPQRLTEAVRHAITAQLPQDPTKGEPHEQGASNQGE